MRQNGWLQTQSDTISLLTEPLRSRKHLQQSSYTKELHDFISVIPDESFVPNLGTTITNTPTALSAVTNTYFNIL